MYNFDVKLKIGRGAKEEKKILRKEDFLDKFGS